MCAGERRGKSQIYDIRIIRLFLPPFFHHTFSESNERILLSLTKEALWSARCFKKRGKFRSFEGNLDFLLWDSPLFLCISWIFTLSDWGRRIIMCGFAVSRLNSEWRRTLYKIHIGLLSAFTRTLLTDKTLEYEFLKILSRKFDVDFSKGSSIERGLMKCVEHRKFCATVWNFFPANILLLPAPLSAFFQILFLPLRI